jgi:hypothetical protein
MSSEWARTIPITLRNLPAAASINREDVVHVAISGIGELTNPVV